MRTILVIAGIAVSAVSYSADRVPAIGWLDFGIADTARTRALEESLRDHGLIAGKTIELVHFSAGGDVSRLAEGARELVRRNVVAIVAPDPPSVDAARSATQTIPIIARVSNDPVATGIVKSLSRPGGNITGVYSVSDGLVQKRIELLHEALPGAKRVAVLWDPAIATSQRAYREAQTAAKSLGIRLISAETRGPAPDFSAELERAKKLGAQAVIPLRNPGIVRASQVLGKLATQHQLPSIFDEQAFVSYGGFLSYGTNLPDLYRHLVSYVVKILSGEQAANLPMEQPTRFELVVNLKSAQELKIRVPQAILQRADRVIE